MAVLGLLLGVLQCSHQEVNPDDPESLFSEAEECLKDEKFLIAVEKFRDIKNRFPYSSRAVDAELRIADTYFEQESYIEAESAYEIFRELHPTHPRSDYVQYRIGLSLFKMVPGNPTRDLSAAYRAIDAFNMLMDRHPSSKFVREAKDHISECRAKLAEYENYVADFYFQRQHYLSATHRYKALLKDFPESSYDAEAMFRLGECYFQTNLFANAKETFEKLVQKYPESSYTASAQARIEKLTKP